MEAFALGYAMGLLVASGSFTGDRTQPSVELRAHRRDLTPLDAVRETLGGQVFGPYMHKGRPLFVYMLRGRELRDALPIIDRHLPQSWKRVQFEAWKAKYREYLERPTPSQALVDRVQRLLPSRSDQWHA